MKSIVVVVFALFVVSLPSGADACCMVPMDYPGDVDQSAQEVVILFDDGAQELILRVKPFFREGTAPPDSLAWLVTVPSKPEHYEVADAGIFDAARALHERLEAYYEAQRPKPLVPENVWGDALPATDARALAQGQGLEIDAVVEVGPYTITPVRATGPEAVDALNAYLQDGGFGTEDPEHLAWFAEHGFTFLCIRITPPEGSATLGRHLDLDPLRIAFASERPYYPGMYSANQGNFGLELTLLTTEPLAKASLKDVGSKLRADRGHDNLFTVTALPDAFRRQADDGLGARAPERWYLNRVDSYGFNPTDAEGRPAILGWSEDVMWDVGGTADLPPDWYHGDAPRPLLHPHNTRPAVGILVLLLVFGGLLAAVLLVWRAMRRRGSAGGA